MVWILFEVILLLWVVRGFLAKKEEDWAKNVAKNVILENVKVKEGGKTVKTDVFGSNLIYNQF